MKLSTIQSAHAKWREAALLHMDGVHPNLDDDTRKQYAYWLKEIRGCYTLRDYGVTWH